MKRTLAFAYGALCYVAFLAVFLYAVGFVGGFGVPKTVDSGATGPLGLAVVVDLALLGLFAVQHSGMARPAFKRVWTRWVPRPIERSTYVLASSLALAVLFWQWRPIPAVVWSVESDAAVALLWIFHALGWLVVLASTYMISHAHLFGLRQVDDYRRGRPPASPEFRLRALYRYVRHPIMLGFVIAFWATPRMTAGHLLFAAASTGYILIGVTLEERDLLAAFGDRYRAYRDRVPMLIPWRGRTGHEVSRRSGVASEEAGRG